MLVDSKTSCGMANFNRKTCSKASIQKELFGRMERKKKWIVSFLPQALNPLFHIFKELREHWMIEGMPFKKVV
ncbi:hypothetical protein D3C84_1241190 [compost metagenome]